MPAKVFISCGQASDTERDVAKLVKRSLEEKGFQAFVATAEQDVYDINSGVISILRDSDYYLFIDFKREAIGMDTGRPLFRGSLFTHQELALAQLLGFAKPIFLVENGVKREGMLNFMAANAKPFTDYYQVVPFVQELVIAQGWTPSFSRHLRADNLLLDPPVRFGDHAGSYYVRVVKVDIQNCRNDIAAKNCSARLKSLTTAGNTTPSPDRSLLKVNGSIGFSQFIWPESHGAFDLLSIDVANPLSVYLHSSLDVTPRCPLVLTQGVHDLAYQIYADDFEVYEFTIRLTLTGNINLSTPSFVSR